MEPREVHHHQGGARATGAFKAGVLTVHHNPEVLDTVAKALRGAGRTVGFVPTMGALHEGHLALIRQAKLANQVVIVSIFVNPLQFGANEDLDAYPRTLDADLELLRTEGVDLVFAPTVSDMYPDGMRTTIQPGPLGAELEGGSRPTHFAGMLTVVAKLLNITHASEAYFGEKDYQQLTLIRQMVRDLNMDAKIVAYPTVREPDGLALSAALAAGRHAAGLGAEAVVQTARSVLDAVDGLDVDYLELRDANLGPAPTAGNARLLVAAKVGDTRLIDNAPVVLGAQIDGHPDANSLPASQAH